MLNQKDQLVELIRELETRKHIFATDPMLVTEQLQKEVTNKPIDKLYRRAERIDSNGKLSATLHKIDARIKAIIVVMSVVWCVSGFLGLFTLLQANVVNFFYVLLCLLGFHSLMLIGWVFLSLFSRKDKPTLFAALVSPSHLIRGKDEVTTAAVELYERQLKHAGMRWYLGKISHQLWLATLVGMMIALIVLLMVRDFSFAWESTLLSSDTVGTLVSWMSWLPDLVGFATPSPEQVVEAQKFAHQVNSVTYLGDGLGDGETVVNTVNNYDWAMLLIGSLLLYGIAPRAIVWVLCVLLFHRKKMTLDTKLPYFQKLFDFWQRQITDDDDFTETVAPVAPKAKVAKGKKLVALLEYAYSDENWYQFIVGHDIEYFGMVDGREDIDRLVELLSKQPMQVLLGIHATALPDRGTMRKLDKIAKSATSGLIVKLLEDTDDAANSGSGVDALAVSQNQAAEQERLQQRLKQWQAALAERNIGLVS